MFETLLIKNYFFFIKERLQHQTASLNNCEWFGFDYKEPKLSGEAFQIKREEYMTFPVFSFFQAYRDFVQWKVSRNILVEPDVFTQFLAKVGKNLNASKLNTKIALKLLRLYQIQW